MHYVIWLFKSRIVAAPQEKALLGVANLTLDEREELAGVMNGLVSGIDRTLQEIGASVKTVSGVTIRFHALEITTTSVMYSTTSVTAWLNHRVAMIVVAVAAARRACRGT